MTLLHPSIQTQEIYPIGSIIEATKPPNDNWLRMEGQLLNRTTYATLLSVLETDNPNAWEQQEIIRPLDAAFDSSGLEEMADDGSRWVAVGWEGDFAYSDDGVTWTSGTLPDTSKDYFSIAYNGSVWCTVGVNTTSAATSNNGSSWTARTLPGIYDWQGICWDGTYFILAADDTTQCYRSTDGITWGAAGTFFQAPEAICSDGSGLTVAISNSYFLISSNGGTNWDRVTLPYLPWGFSDMPKISYANGYFMMNSHINAGHTWISDDGYNWKQIWYYGGPNWSHDRDNQESVTRWKYFKDQWFGMSTNDVGVRSPDLKTFYPWYQNIGNQSAQTDMLYNSSSGKIVIIEGWYRYMTVCEEYKFDESTYFQLPRRPHNSFGINNVHNYIRIV